LDHPNPNPRTEAVHIVVEVDGSTKTVTLDRSPATGREIRAAAGAAMTDDLTRLVHNKPSGGNIGLDEAIEVRNGDKFLALAAGTVS